MNTEQFRRVRKIFERASELPRDQHRAFLDDACPDDPVVRAEVEQLLGEADPNGQAEHPGGEPRTQTIRGEGERTAPERIGPYKLIRVIGEGGMGIVYEAEQDEPVRRTVALKVVRQGLVGEQALARFESERQALALMNHPNVARVLDVGTDEHGCPYFAMEFIRGVSITDYCDRHNLSTRERLDLMIQVCSGTQHAHQKGIIHRDLKPSNILVEIRDEKPVPKIIDFGVAKAIDRHVSERAYFTEYGQIIGTPEYMSPEQVEMTGLDVDTRTDVYSLGVLLYEVLVGALPFDSRELRRAGYDEIRRRIREETPPKPSTRLATLGDASNEVARHRNADPATLVRTCTGDLDWITMKALEKDRTHRYASASEFAADIRRYLADEPVTAGPPSVTYRAKKFIRRHRVGVGVGAALALAFLIGFAGTAYGLVRALRAERQTRLEAETVAQVSDFMADMFEINDPSEARGNTITAREILDRGAGRIRGELAERPALQGRLMGSMGVVYRGLGLYGDALPLLDSAVESLTRAHGEDHPEVASNLTTLAGLLILRGRGEEALPLLDRAMRIHERTLDDADPERARTLNNIGNAHRAARRYRDSLLYFQESLSIRESALGPDHPDVAKVLGNLGSAHLMLENYDEARGFLERALAIFRGKLDPDHPYVAKALNNLATLHRKTGDLPRARETLAEVLAIREKTLGPEHPRLVESLLNLALVEKADGHLALARDHLERALAIADRKLEEDHRLVRPTIVKLIEVSRELGDTKRAGELEARLRGRS